MKILILDGQMDSPNPTWRAYLNNLIARLLLVGHTVTLHRLSEIKAHHCIGCFDCWIKTPGMCVFHDDLREINRQMVQSDFVLWASPLYMGFPSSLLKKSIDRSIPLIHPYFEIIQGEVHHQKRYGKYPAFGLLVQPGDEDTQKDLDIIKHIFTRACLNIKSGLAFLRTTETSVEILAELIGNPILKRKMRRETFVKELDQIPPPHNILVINGSPRGMGGNTAVMLGKFAAGFTSIPGNAVDVIHLRDIQNVQSVIERMGKADFVMIGFPLYTDAMPAITMELFESLPVLAGADQHPALAFLVQSGFPESAHSRFIERYLVRVAERLNSSYLGTLVRGGCEGVRMMPDSMNRKMLGLLYELGKQLARDGFFQVDSIKSFAGLERYPQILTPFLFLLTKTNLLNYYWNMQLKKNGVYSDRFAAPFI